MGLEIVLEFLRTPQSLKILENFQAFSKLGNSRFLSPTISKPIEDGAGKFSVENRNIYQHKRTESAREFSSPIGEGAWKSFICRKLEKRAVFKHDFSVPIKVGLSAL